MANKKNVLEMLVVVLAFGITVVGFIGCSADGGGGGSGGGGGGGGGSGGGGGGLLPEPIAWTSVHSPFSSGDDNYITTITYGGSKFVAGNRMGEMVYSSDGTNWTKATQSVFAESYHISMPIAYGKGKFVAGGSAGKMAYSSDGTSWTAITQSVFGLSNMMSMAIAYGDNKFVAGGSGIVAGNMVGSEMAYSSNGTSWTTITQSVFSRQSRSASPIITAITYGGSKFVAGNRMGEMVYSSNGINWTAVSHYPLSSTEAIAYGDGKFVVVNGYMAYSLNGINWTAISAPPSSHGVVAIAYGDGKFVVGGKEGEIAVGTFK